MTEQTPTTETAPVTPPVTEQKTETPPERQRPPGYEPVDFDKLNLTPEQRAAIEPRVRYLYGNLKKGEAERAELRKYMDDLQRDIDERIKPLETEKVQNDEARLTHAIKQARDEGRVEDELKLTKELHKVTEPKPEPKKTEPDTFTQLKGPIEAWAGELDDRGNLRRPWIAEDHPDHELAQGKLMSLAKEWERAGHKIGPENFPIFAQQLEARMGKPNGQARTAAVLSTSQQTPPAQKAGDLTSEEKHFADRTLGHIKDPVERYRRYASHKVIRTRA